MRRRRAALRKSARERACLKRLFLLEISRSAKIIRSCSARNSGSAPSRHDEPQTNKGDDAHLMEEDMNKTLIALATATLAIAATVSQAG